MKKQFIYGFLMTCLFVGMPVTAMADSTCRKIETTDCEIPESQTTSTLLQKAYIKKYLYYSGDLYDEEGYRVCYLNVEKGTGDKKLLERIKIRRRLPFYDFNRIFEEAHIQRNRGAYYIMFPIQDPEGDDKKMFCANMIQNEYNIEFIYFGTQDLTSGEVYVSDPKFPQRKVLTNKELEEIALQLIRILKGEEPPDYATEEEVKRREVAWEKMLKDLEKHTYSYAVWEWKQRNKAQKIYLWIEDSVFTAQRADRLLKLAEFAEYNTIPNICEGVEGFRDAQDYIKPATLKKLKSKGKQAFEIEYAKSGPLTFAYKISNGESAVYVLILHTYNPTMARNAMLFSTVLKKLSFSSVASGYVNAAGNAPAADIVERIRWNPGRVGDYDVALRPLMTAEGEIIKRSEHRGAYFMRGNTTVAVWADDAELNVLPLAQELDKKIAEYLKKQGIPLVREQKYLKND